MKEQILTGTGANKLYARVQGNQVIEYPVTSETIAKRGHQVSLYHEVNIVPFVLNNDAGMMVETDMAIDGNMVTITHKYREKTLEESVFFFRKAFTEGVWLPFKYAEVPNGEILFFQKKLGQAAMANIDAVAKERYDSLDTLLSRYSNSSNPVWKKEAAFMQSCVDALWVNLLKYFQDTAAGLRPLPVSLEEVDALIKPPSWSDMK